MRSSTIATVLLPSLAAAALHPVYNTHIEARHIQLVQPTPTSLGNEKAPEPTIFVDDLKRAVDFDPNAPAQPPQSQYPSVTTRWVETELADGQTTWVEIIYTQLFSAVPSQGALPGAGNIGLGTITGAVGVVRTTLPRSNAVKTTGMEGLGWSMGIAVLGAMGVGAGLVLL